ncbi:MAG: hypothetical protein IT320_08930 [Anaerolineae bacterium]|nr:hypothetical protein [Anaerolineae bacterium]
MLRGFRWQLLALFLAVILFAASLIFRSQIAPAPSTPENAPTVDVTAAPTEIVVALEPTPTVPTATPPPAGTISTFREGLVGSIQRLNPVFADLNPVDRDITSLIFEGLTRTNAYGESEPALAQSWITSSDGLEYVFTLRDDVLWQDGIPFSAVDVAYTMSILRAPDFPGSPELHDFWRTVETEVIGERLVRFRLTQPLGTFPDMLQIGILPEHALRGTNGAQLASHPFNLAPIGTGPYQLEQIQVNDQGEPTQLDLRAAPVYRQRREATERYSIERVSFAFYDTFDSALGALSSGTIDGLAAQTAQERRQLFDLANGNASVTLNTQLEPVLGALIFNWQRESTRFFREQRIRVALQTGLDRSSVIERNLSNIAVEANSPLMPNSWAYVPDLPWPAYAPDTARAELQLASERLAAAAARNADDESTDDTTDATAETATEAAPSENSAFFHFNILVPDEPSLVSLAQEIAAQWAQLNLTVAIETADLATYRARLEAGDFDTAVVEYALGASTDPDVYTFWHQGQFAPDGLNYGGADDRTISQLLERARRDPNGINRIEFYQEFQQEFAERAIAIPLYYPLFTYATSAHVSNVQLGTIGAASDRFRNLGDWRVN